MYSCIHNPTYINIYAKCNFSYIYRHTINYKMPYTRKKALDTMSSAFTINRTIVIYVYMERVVRDSMKGTIAYRLFIVLGCSIISLFAVICRCIITGFSIGYVSSILVADHNMTIFHICKQVFYIDVV